MSKCTSNCRGTGSTKKNKIWRRHEEQTVWWERQSIKQVILVHCDKCYKRGIYTVLKQKPQRKKYAAVLEGGVMEGYAEEMISDLS